MKHQWTAGCEFPTTILFVDDSSLFLDPIIQRMRSKQVACKPFHTPIKLLEYLKKNYAPLTIFDQCIKTILDCEFADQVLTDHTVNIDLPAIKRTLYQSNRFAHHAIAVIDHSMANMNGIELARQIKQVAPSIKIIMLTGQASDRTGILGWSEGILDFFMNKDSLELVNDLFCVIQSLQQQYFQEHSHTIIKLLSANQEYPLTNPIVIDFIEKIKKDKKIIEHYLLNDMGNLMLVDARGQIFLLGFYTTEILKQQYNDITNVMDEIPKVLAKNLKDQSKAIFYFSSDDFIRTEEAWKELLHPILPIPNTRYYYTLIQDTSAYDIQLNKITSYDQFLEKNKKSI